MRSRSCTTASGATRHTCATTGSKRATPARSSSRYARFVMDIGTMTFGDVSLANRRPIPVRVRHDRRSWKSSTGRPPSRAMYCSGTPIFSGSKSTLRASRRARARATVVFPMPNAPFRNRITQRSRSACDDMSSLRRSSCAAVRIPMEGAYPASQPCTSDRPDERRPSRFAIGTLPNLRRRFDP